MRERVSVSAWACGRAIASVYAYVPRILLRSQACVLEDFFEDLKASLEVAIFNILIFNILLFNI